MKGLARLFGMASDIEEKNSVQTEEVLEPKEIEDVKIDAVEDKQDIQIVPIDAIIPNPFQPRKNFLPTALEDLAASIREYGVIQPLLVRQSEHGFELVAGERRLRASKLAGLVEVPVIVKKMEDKETAEIAMIENLQREDLHFLEEAEGFSKLMATFAFTQEELAKRMGKSQSTIANKLRLLKLSDQIRGQIFSAGLTERHARVLLKLPQEEMQVKALTEIIDKQMNVRETEQFIEKILETAVTKKKTKKKVVGIVRDVRIYLNTINQLTKQMKKSGLQVEVKQEQSEEYITVSMVIPKQKK